ncbi:FAD-dependent monooxygenase [Alphaproteobacteria bacterium]|nr:FAD-dependent monooxygenase [Alphaproteobacteria bacterium]
MAAGPKQHMPVDIIIAGAGLSAQLAALALTHAGFDVAMPSVPNEVTDIGPDDDMALWQSVVALSPHVGHMFGHLGVATGPFGSIADMQLDVRSSDQDAPLKPDLIFPAAPTTPVDKDTDSKSYLANVYSLAGLSQAVLRAVHKSDRIRFVDAPLVYFRDGIATLENGETLTASLCVDSSGRHSSVRKDAGIAITHGIYDQDAITTWLKLSGPHLQTARQYFTPYGPLALLPLPFGSYVALVWSQERARADALIQTSDDIFRYCLEEVIGQGMVEEMGSRQKISLEYLLAETFCQDGLILIGESAHVVHPLAGQGLNLTCRDIAQLVDVLTKARHMGLGLRAPTLLEDYAIGRRADAALTLGLTHGLKNILQPLRPTVVPAEAFRLAGTLLKDVPGLSAYFEQQAATGFGEIPSLFRGSKTP